MTESIDVDARLRNSITTHLTLGSTAPQPMRAMGSRQTEGSPHGRHGDGAQHGSVVQRDHPGPDHPDDPK
ncbi:hypothetical protein [uncultured Ralstonia sp.]|jgi:hypothetical protein|uniref:hypothetical protein n=1 Tax=Ralstonia sp. TaxID=54061 RepID=UPI001EA72AA6|nr:hypothetical protein [uncultured Ralstonia sp.]UCF26590.1 MAG: hypothetical protein JSV72_20705 [Ralstonia sp.]